jgi:hypothetical protein
MLLLFPCPGTIPAPSCQKSCCMPLSSGCSAVASSCLSTAPTTAPTPSSAWTPFLHHQGQVPGRDCPHQPPQSLHGSGHHTLQSAMPRLTFWQVPRLSRRHQVSCFQTCWLPCLPLLRRRHAAVQELFSSRRPVSCTPWTGGTIPVYTVAVPAPSAVTASD